MQARRPKQRSQPKPASSGGTHVAIIGAGRGGTALLEIFAKDPLVQIVGVAETDGRAPGVPLARRLRIPVFRDYRDLLAMEHVDLFIDVSGDPKVGEVLQEFTRRGVPIIGGATAKFMWQLIEARIRATAEIERTLNKYQTLYRLYVKEAGAAVEQERTRIACEIHDGLVQSLAGVNFKLDLCEELAEKDPPACLGILRETKQHVKLAIQEARQVIFNLRPVHFDKMELVPALRSYLKSYETQSGIKTTFTVSGNENRLFPKTKMFLFRILQEALGNVQEHAKADRVSVQLEIGREAVTATVTDTGVGFDPTAVSRDPEKWDHFGLRGMAERARLIGGEATIQSKRGQGTRVRIKVPFLKKEGVRHGTH